MRAFLAAMLAVGALPGCHFTSTPAPDPLMPPPQPVGSEQSKVSLPLYTIEPPDILEVNAIKVVPKAPYRIGQLDYLQIRVNGALQDQPISGTYAVEPGGTINLGASYGRVKVSGMTLDEAAEAIYKQLSRILKQPQVSVVLGASAGLQQVGGQHRVGLDGTINLGVYGSVFVTGMTVEEARQTIEAHLSTYLESPEVSVDVFTYASKNYYIISQGAGLGDRLLRIPITGNETVLDAIAQTNGLSQVSSKKIWIARPTPNGCDQILNVSWDEITRGAATKTNYQILPGDRVYIAEDKFIAFNSFINKIFSPLERVFGISTLGVESIEQLKHPNQQLGNGL
jgi:polysaccharide export outer membrane protein